MTRTMGLLSLLFAVLAVSLSSHGNIIQISHSLGTFDLAQMIRSTDRNNNAVDGPDTEVIFHSQSSRDSVESSGYSVDSTQKTDHIAKVYLSTGNGESRNLPRRSSAPSFLTSLLMPRKVTTRTIVPEGIASATTPAPTVALFRGRDQQADKANTAIIKNSHFNFSEHVNPEETFSEGSQTTDEEQLNDTLTDGHSPKHPVQHNMLDSVTNQDLVGPGSPCVLGLSGCVVLTNLSGTNLLWDDMSRTLAFAWELHVFGSAGLFILMAVTAALGMFGARTLPHPLCDALTLTNGLLMMSGTLRAVLLLLDPYGTRQILSRAALAALHNLPLLLLLWAQVTLTLVTLRGSKLILFPSKLQHPWVVGGLAVLHCAPLLLADLLSPHLSPALPLLLQTLSLCWGLPFCIGILIQSLSPLHCFFGSSVPQWGASQGIENRSKRVTAVCALLGVVCCSLQIYSLLWLYGLLGNWRHFGWGWWLSQFWVRILELSWGFSELVVGSWIFWKPPRRCLRRDHGQGRGDVSKGMEETSFWSTLLGPLRKSKKTPDNLMPNNWAKYSLSKTGIRKNTMLSDHDHAAVFTSKHTFDPVSNSSRDSQTALLWQKAGERKCILSLIEFDMQPPSPVDLRHSIDNALHNGHFVSGGLFTPPPSSSSHSVGKDTTDGDGGAASVLPAYVVNRCTLKTESVIESPDRFQAEEPIQSPHSPTDHLAIQSPTTGQQGEKLNTRMSAVLHQEDWSDEESTDL